MKHPPTPSPVILWWDDVLKLLESQRALERATGCFLAGTGETTVMKGVESSVVASWGFS